LTSVRWKARLSTGRLFFYGEGWVIVAVILDDARCLSCDYSLRGLTAPRCPECGRPFDPGDPLSFHAGKSLRRPIRFLLSPTGFLYSIPAAILLAILYYLSGIPHPLPKAELIDVYFYFFYPFYHSRAQFVALDAGAKVFVVILFGTIILFSVWLLRWLGRIAISMILRRRRYYHFRPLPQIVFGLLMVAIVLVMLYGWPNRIAQTWTTQLLNNEQPRFGEMNLSREQRAVIFRACIVGPRDPRHRLAGISLVSQRQREQLLKALRDAIFIERDPTVLAAELHILGLARAEPDAALLDRFLTHANPDIRAAAADALGIWHNPAYSISHEGIPGTPKFLETDPPINVSWAPAFVEGAIPSPLPAARRQVLLQMMLNGPSLQEREAAARALLPWPSEGYKLRVAEWGVFAALNGRFEFSKSILDENPPFVHRLSDSAASLSPRLGSWGQGVFKPVIHVTVSKPMSIDMEVRIEDGRPWVAYPAIDDYVPVGSGQIQRPGNGRIPLLDPANTSTSPDLREGYPWLLPHHHVVDGPPLSGLGVRWQSLIVSPEHLGWMKEAPVPADPKYQWWNQLRKVNSSWISSRGESERFLYYDGPTMTDVPFKATLENNVLMMDGAYGGLFIRVANRKSASAALPLEQTLINIDKLLAANPDPNPPVALLNILTDHGLTPSEAQGLLDAWSPRFFNTPGQRLLLFYTSEEYNNWLCPMRVRPEPTELVRVGILLFEFGNQN
jgi:hypothetical protein